MTFIPAETRVVTGFTINDGGSGYSSTPTVTISGGSGQNATATATVTDGVITALTITNQGSGYETPPTVTITDSTGVDADIDAIIGELDYRQKLEHTIQRQLPEFIQNEHQTFVSFLEAYYRFLDQTGEANDILLNMAEYADIDETTDLFVEEFRKQFATELPINVTIGLRRLVKLTKDLYESKGSERSIELLFRLLFDEAIEFFYPSQHILRASDGIWVKDTVLRVIGDSVDEAHSDAPLGDIFDLKGRIVDIYSYVNNGSIVTPQSVEATIKNVTRIAYTDPPVYELSTSLSSNYDLKIPGAGAETSAIVVDGAVKAVSSHNNITFDAATAVDGTSDEISRVAHGFVTGDWVIYRDGGGTAITGLTDGKHYVVIRIDDDTLQLAADSADAGSGTQIDIDVGVGTDHSLFGIEEVFPDSDVNTTDNEITITSHPFSTGDVVLYQVDSDGTKIGGLTEYAYYYVIDVDTDTIKLATSSTNAAAETAISLTSTGSGNHSLSVPMVNEGNGFYAAPTVVFTTTTGTGATGRAVISAENTLSHIVITEGGSGYTMGLTSVNFDTDPIRTHIHLQDTLTPVYGYVQRQLTSVSVSGCTGTPPCLFEVGDLITINESGVDGPYATNYFAEDYTQDVSENRGVIRITAVDSDGCPTSAEIFQPGFGYFREEFTVTYTHPVSGCTATFAFTTGALRSAIGYWKDSRGKISDSNYLQDNYYYQEYSYVIRSGVASNKWLDILKKTLHPAGTEVFGELIITQTVDYSTNIGLGGNIHFYEFDWNDEPVTSETHYVDFYKPLEDTSTVTEAHVVDYGKNVSDSTSGATEAIDNFDFDKVFADTGTTSEVNSFDFSKVLTDSVSATESLQVSREFFFTDHTNLFYFAEDYTSEEYQSPDFAVISVANGESDTSSATDAINLFTFGKGLSDTGTASESTAATINKILTDSVTVTEVLAKELPGLSLTDSASLADSSIVSAGLIFTETATTSQSFNKVLQLAKSDSGTTSELVLTETDFDRDPGETVGIDESSRVVINKGLAESLGITDSGNINNQNYVESGYVSGVGAEGDTFGSNTTF